MIKLLKKFYSHIIPLRIRNIVLHVILKRGCTDPETIFLAHVRRIKALSASPIVCAEVGVDKGTTTREVVALLESGDQLDLYDRDTCYLFKNRLQNIPNGLKVNYLANTSRLFDSYAWTLANEVKVSKAGRVEEKYDLIFLDGAHVFHVDAAATCFLKELLKVGGIIIFSDMTWTVAESFSTNTRRNRKLFPEVQLKACHVSLIVDTLVRTDNRFEEIDSEDPDCSIFRRVAV